MINNFIIIGEARSGTTSLTGSINSGLRTPENRFWSNGIESQPVLGEPFTLLFKLIDDPDPSIARNRPLYNYVHGENGFFTRLPERTKNFVEPKRSPEFKIEDRHDTPQYVFDDVIDLSHKENNGIKEIVRGESYCEKLLKATSRHSYRYLHLRRHNHLAMAISFWMSKQHNVWNFPANWPENKKFRQRIINKFKDFNLQPLDILELEKHVARLDKRKEIFEDIKNQNWITVEFKDLYSTDHELRYSTYLKIVDFINLDIHSEIFNKCQGSHAWVDMFFGDGKRVTQNCVYDKIPNLKEILSHFNYTKEQLSERI
jgi:hypothetical protein